MSDGKRKRRYLGGKPRGPVKSTEHMTVHIPIGTRTQMAALMDEGESTSAFLRMAVCSEIARRLEERRGNVVRLRSVASAHLAP